MDFAEGSEVVDRPDRYAEVLQHENGNAHRSQVVNEGAASAGDHAGLMALCTHGGREITNVDLGTPDRIRPCYEVDDPQGAVVMSGERLEGGCTSDRAPVAATVAVVSLGLDERPARLGLASGARRAGEKYTTSHVFPWVRGAQSAARGGGSRGQFIGTVYFLYGNLVTNKTHDASLVAAKHVFQ